MEFVLIILGGFLVIGFIRHVLRMNHMKEGIARRRHAQIIAEESEHGTRTGEESLPTWVNDRDRREEFLYGIVKLAQRKSVSGSFLRDTFEDPRKLKSLLVHAHLIEQQRSGFTAQTVAVTGLVVDLWNRLDPQTQRKYREADAQRQA